MGLFSSNRYVTKTYKIRKSLNWKGLFRKESSYVKMSFSTLPLPTLTHMVYLIEDGQKQDREWNTNYLDLQFVIHMSDFYDHLTDGR